MNEFITKILSADFINRDVKRFTITKPVNYYFTPGQSTDVAINLPGWKNQFRPFTFTGLNERPYLEFTIKIYTDHEGVTNQLSKVNAGAELIIKDPYGSISFKEPGVFIAGGSGINPFMAIFRDLYEHQTKVLQECVLINSNKTSDDIIYGEELIELLDGRFINVFTREHTIGFLERRIDRDFLVENIGDFSRHFYVCGPDEFVKNITSLLLQLGANADTLTF